MFTSRPPIPYEPMEKTPLNWVRTAGELEAMLEKLRQSQEIAVDLEHHDYRTYGGFLCLMQISTREEDWLVDLLLLRDEIQSLNEVFTDPSIVKVLQSPLFLLQLFLIAIQVFHGAESDIVWLQQNFSVYVVTLFDTYHASKLLGEYHLRAKASLNNSNLRQEFPRHGLAQLLEMYCDFIPDKRYQLADWRIRCALRHIIDVWIADRSLGQCLRT